MRPKRNEVVHRGGIVSFNICAEELPSLREPNRVETVLEFRDVCNLFGDEVDLVVHVSVLQRVHEQTATCCGRLTTHETGPAVLFLVLIDVHGMNEDTRVDLRNPLPELNHPGRGIRITWSCVQSKAVAYHEHTHPCHAISPAAEESLCSQQPPRQTAPRPTRGEGGPEAASLFGTANFRLIPFLSRSQSVQVDLFAHTQPLYQCKYVASSKPPTRPFAVET